MSKKGIFCYVDNNPKCVEEFTWLYKTWMLHNIKETWDLVVFHHPDIQIPTESGLIKIRRFPLHERNSKWSKYKFIESIVFINEYPDIVKEYDYILKTDCDVFLTEHIKNLEPTYTIVGRGHYNFGSNDISENLFRVAKDLNIIRHDNLSNIGSEFIAKNSTMSLLMDETYKITEYLLNNEFKNTEGKWPGWYKGVSSMYAFDIAINHHLIQDFWYAGLGLAPYLVRKIGTHDYHIHAFPSNSDFSKQKFFNKQYGPEYYKTKDKDSVAGYCFNVAYLTIEDLIKKYK